ncbi:MAG: hypothetical protein EXQ53_12530 [Acidobacteria bacterium]|nr:hypothetical protein [Acidobacteriota bacterium]
MGRVARTIADGALIIAACAAMHAGIAAAQSDPDADRGAINVEVDPIRCWWRASVGAVRVGEPFSIVLTCAVIENAVNTVVADQSRIQPAALQLPPFDVIGGRRFADRRTPDYLFFQYEYQARLIQEDAFGTDVALPELDIKYRIRTRTPDGSAVDGREQVYLLPPVSIRVLSLVPGDASDIRDADEGTFADVDAQAFRATLWRLIAIVLFSLGAIMAIQALVRLARQFVHRDDTPRQLMPPVLVLRRASRELDAVRRQRAHEGWSDGGVGRALAALRIVGAYSLARRTGQAVTPVTSQEVAGHEGQLVVDGGWLRNTKVLVSGAVTAGTVADALANAAPGGARRTDLEDLQTALARFAAAQYGREGSGLDEAALDESLDRALALARRVTMQQRWAVKTFGALAATATALGRRVWSR